MNTITTFLIFLLMLVITFAVYILSKKFLFSKVKINKWIPLSIAIVLVIVQMALGKTNNYISYGLSIVSVVFILWFTDIMQRSNAKNKNKKNEKQIVIKSKAKPNRVKKK